MLIKSPEDLKKARQYYQGQLERQVTRVLVCSGTGCIASGSFEVYKRLRECACEAGLTVDVMLAAETPDDDCPGKMHENAVNQKNISSETDSSSVVVGLKRSGCHGFCELGPLVRIEPQGWLYIKVTAEDVADIVEKTLIQGEPVERLLYQHESRRFARQDEIPFYRKQTRIVLKGCGTIDADAIEEYIAHDGYQSLCKALFDMNPSDICQSILDANLRGRGGGGYPTGRKWQQVARQDNPIKYVVCNGDEGDPGAFMDRSIMEGNPHLMIEGMVIAAVATGAHEGYIYVRAEYPLAVARLQHAIEAANHAGLLGHDILGSGFHFNLQVNQGAGAFVCGEGSALTASIEGERGMPRVKPPRTVERGLFECPTVLNNVETFANVPIILEKGAAWYRAIGPENSPGTKAFAITGSVRNTGLIEVPMGTTLREVIFDIGGGIRGGRDFKAVQIGGPSGGCLTSAHLDLPLDFDSLTKVGAMIGSGGMVVMDDQTCMVEIARFFMSFTQNESCGKCVPCREGTKRMLEILERIVAGQGTLEDLDWLESLADTISETSLCGLGKTAAGPVLSTLKYFRHEYESHVLDKRCPAGVCQALRKIVIQTARCKGCGKCAKVCPAGAITGKPRSAYTISQDTCIHCRACLDSCAFKAITEEV